MKQVCINCEAIVLNGVAKGFKGNVIAFNSEIDEVIIELDRSNYLITESDNINQFDFERGLF